MAETEFHQLTSAKTYEQINDQKYDVIIFDKATKKIVNVPGENLPTFRENAPCASDIYQTHSIRIDSKNYDIDIVETGTFKKGDIYK